MHRMCDKSLLLPVQKKRVVGGDSEEKSEANTQQQTICAMNSVFSNAIQKVVHMFKRGSAANFS